MERKKKRKLYVGIMIAVIISIISLGVAFAAFSTTLHINGDSEIEPSSWDIYFTTADDGDKPGIDGAEIPASKIQLSNLQPGIEPSVTATGSMVATTLTWHAVFKTPGDRVVYTVYLKNGGSYNAKVTNVNLPNITCYTGNPTIPETTVCSHIHYGVFLDANGETPVAVNQTINHGTTQPYYLIVYLDNTGWALDGSDLPTQTVYTNLISGTVSFGQAN
jgi:hypothetical protein